MSGSTDTDRDERQLLVVEEAEAGQRLDAFLAGRDPQLSRTRFKALIKSGQVSVGGRTLDEPNYRVNAGDEVLVAIPELEDATPKPEAIPLDIVFEDEHLIVIDKPAGMVVHPAAGNWTGTLVNALLHHCGASLSGIGGVRRPGIVHRLDKETSGLIVVAKTDAAHKGLAEQFADHSIKGPLERAYLALVWGVPSPAAGRIETFLDRDPKNRQRQAVVKSGGRRAVTHYATEERLAGDIASLERCRLETGRTHQIRVHLAHVGHPLVGDLVYGAGFLTKAELLPPPLASRVRKFRRQALHAAVLGFRHPVSGDKMTFESELPAEMAALVDDFRTISAG
ncbi:MAG TPA: RluA family pseudouridine synthase [Afifellaceae bacterium]|nr:RluA family pseudouridine synthase [Afifellaceae bacterium]